MLVKIFENFYFGDLISAQQRALELKHKKIAILSILDEKVKFENIQIHQQFYMNDDGFYNNQFVAKNILPFAVEFIDANLKMGRIVIVHCRAGVNRSAFVICGYLIKHQKMSLSDAIKYVYRLRPIININTLLLSTLKTFQKNCLNK